MVKQIMTYTRYMIRFLLRRARHSSLLLLTMLAAFLIGGVLGGYGWHTLWVGSWAFLIGHANGEYSLVSAEVEARTEHLKRERQK